MLAGDYNIIPTDLDVYKPERWLDDALFAPEAKQAYQRLPGQGWTDALRRLHPDEQIFTFWDYFRNAFAAQRRAPDRPSPAEQAGGQAAAVLPGVDREVRELGEDQRSRTGLGRARMSAIAPMEALLAEELPQGGGWQYEPKWDGFRCVAVRDGARCRAVVQIRQAARTLFPGDRGDDWPAQGKATSSSTANC